MIGNETVVVESIAHAVAAALSAEQLELPALPDMAIKVREALADPDTSLEQAVHLVSCDPVVAVHVMKAANSSAFHGATRVNTLRAAISRIGYRMLYGIVMNIVLTKLFRARRKTVDERLRSLWRQSREVAAHCFVLAEQERLHPEFALLAGLVHRIGAFPLCLYADRFPTELAPAALDELVRNHAESLSVAVLEHWDFPDEVVAILSGRLDRTSIVHPETADYVDILELAIRLQECTVDHACLRNLGAAERLRFYPGDYGKFVSMHEDEIEDMRGLLGVPGASPAGRNREIEAPATAESVQPPAAASGVLNSLGALFRRRLPPGR